ncbi:hypothetical protein [Mesorhizobium sp. RMAD-H1]|uniref:hypothetical protein n=1 Tax=Mesorhizobium sp. RMAD-H1 TaxID=2587065 RepID=UPI00160ACFBB|nr:hypothetical protein [Mesorhizobium sp. RMAD-H1]MBB2973236.1 hypothetical protein [Mesorhizobium sp. RMAD-H1]
MTRQSIQDRILTASQNSGPDEPLARLPSAPRSAWRAVRYIAVAGAFAVVVAGAVVLSFRFYPALGEFVAGTASAQSQAQAENKPQEAGAAAAAQSPFQKHASQAGIRTCANVFAALGQALTLGTTYTEQTQWNTASPDTHPVQAIAGMTYDLPDYKAQAAGVVFASPVGKGCEGGFVRVAPFQKTCQEVLQTLPKGSVLADNLSNSTLVNLANNGGQALLVPTGNSCVVVSVARLAG